MAIQVSFLASRLSPAQILRKICLRPVSHRQYVSRRTIAVVAARETYQRSFSKPQISSLRKESQNMQREGSLVVVNLGKAGLTNNFFASIGDALQTNEFVKVKVGTGCYLELDDVIRQCERETDSICVHKVGFTLTLFREKGLPRVAPDMQMKPRPESQSEMEQQESDSEADDVDAASAAREQPPPPPPMFEVKS